jgi:hypothetical protein
MKSTQTGNKPEKVNGTENKPAENVFASETKTAGVCSGGRSKTAEI